MADEEDSDEPAVVLGERTPVEGAPLARISARLMWGIETSAIDEREGETTIRTPDGPRELGAILDELDRTYFATRQEFENAVREVLGSGPVPTAGDDPEESLETAEADESAAEPDAEDADEAEGVDEVEELEVDDADEAEDADETAAEADADDGEETAADSDATDDTAEETTESSETAE